VVSAFLERPLELGVRGAAGLVAFPVFMHGIGKRPGEHLLRLLTAAAVRGADRLRQGLGWAGKLGITLSMPVSAKTRRTGGPGMTSSTSPPSALALLCAAIRVCSPDESQNRVRVISTTSVVPGPVAAALSRADRSSSALAMSISAGAATTGTPCTTATGNLASGIRAPAVAACAAAVAGYGCRDGLHLMARETFPPRSRRSRRRGRSCSGPARTWALPSFRGRVTWSGWPALRDSPGRAAICEVLVERYAHLVQACVRPYQLSPERSKT
jgi:hypothetical protein